MTGIGFMVFTGVEWTLAASPSKLTPDAAQALNMRDGNYFFPSIAGLFIFGLAAGVAVLRSALLPQPLGWTAIVIGVISFSPLFIQAMLALFAWTIAAAILIHTRTTDPGPINGVMTSTPTSVAVP